jgi:two-component system NarL family sensor kinase
MPETTQNKKRQSATEKLRKRNRELAILNAIAETLNQAIDVNTALQNALALVIDLMELDTGWVWLLDEEENHYLAAEINLPPFLTEKPSRMRGGCDCMTTFKNGDLTGAANVNVIECSRLWRVLTGTNGLQYHCSVPIYAHGKKLGVLNVASSDWRMLGEDDLQLMYTIGYQIGVAVERGRLYEQATLLATAEERNRLAREIHDTLAQGLAGMALNLETADALLANPTKLEKAREYIRKTLNLARENLEEARRSVLDLRIASLQDKPVAQALAQLVEDFGRETGIEISFNLVGDTPPTLRYQARVEAGIYRIAQEALTNIRKHAQTDRAHVCLALENADTPERKRLRLIISDWGKGFNPAYIPATIASHFGLKGMNERARLLGGALAINSTPGEGTQIELVLPL